MDELPLPAQLPRMRTAAELYADVTVSAKLSTGCPVLDACVGGGICRRGITEITGESASGKTQLCLQLLVQAQAPAEAGGLSGSALFISTEPPVPSKRLAEIAVERGHTSALSSIFVETASDVAAVQAILARVPILARKSPLCLVVIDSVTSLFRGEFSSSAKDLKLRADLLFKLSSTMRALSEAHGLAFVVVNQVSDVMSDATVSPFGLVDHKVEPALGLCWANCVNSRVMLSRVGTSSTLPRSLFSVSEEKEGTSALPPEATLRQMSLLLSPCAPHRRATFIICTRGIEGLSPL